MTFYNLKNTSEQYSFKDAVKIAIGSNQGLLFPKNLPKFSPVEIDELLELDFVERSSKILYEILKDDVSHMDTVKNWVTKAFTFPVPLTKLGENGHVLELFSGPTLAFKDFGARFMAQALLWASQEEKSGKDITILTATSGDTGGAVANAFYGIENIKVVILYPKDMVTPLQQRVFTTLDKNIHSIEIAGNFDDSQSLVKDMFLDEDINKNIILNSANSINIARLLAQTCYYFEAISQLPQDERKNMTFCVPSGNFGNLCAGLIAKNMGLPIKKFIAGTNINDTIPRYLNDNIWQPKKTQATLSNAMDISLPSNWVRIEQGLYDNDLSKLKQDVSSNFATDQEIKDKMLEIYKNHNYIIDPHTANGLAVIGKELTANDKYVVLSTAHPAKFQEKVESILNISIPLPPQLANLGTSEPQKHKMPCNFTQLKQFLLEL